MQKLITAGLCCTIAMLFLACSKDQNALNVTPGGYEYKVCDDNDGEVPQTGEFVFFDLVIKSGDSLLQSSFDQGQPLAAKLDSDNKMYGNFAPVIDMIRTMTPGDSCILYFPKDSFANAGGPSMAMYADVLTYEVKMREIKNEEAYKIYQDSINAVRNAEAEIVRAREAEVSSFVVNLLNDYKNGALDNVQTTASGLKYVIHEEGNPEIKVNAGDYVSVHYYGVLEKDMSMFDNSFAPGRPIQFTVGRREVIEGWDEGLQLLNEGGKATLIIPFELAYGKAGRAPSIPEEANLVFYVEMEKVEKR